MRTVVQVQLAMSLVIGFGWSLAGCLHKTPIVATDTFCDIARPISYSSRDTDQTRAEVLSHNAAGCAVCGEHPVWKPRCTGQYAPMAPVP